MKRGFQNTILTPNDKVRSGNRATHRAQRKQEWAIQKSKPCKFVFFDSQGVVYKEFVSTGQTVNKQYYREVLERLRKRVHLVRPEIADNWMLHHDNAPCHTVISVKEVLAKKVFQWFRSHHTRLILVRVTSFSQNSNSTSKVVILEMWTTSKRSWQTSWRHFYMKTSSIATGSGSKVSGGVWLPKGTTLKGIMLIYR